MHNRPNVSRRAFLAQASALAAAGLVGSGGKIPTHDRTNSTSRLDLRHVTCAQFAACLGDTFLICPTGTGPIEVQLVRTRELRRACASRSEPRNPFTLQFRGQEGEALPQGTYDVEHVRLGRFSLFIVPVGQPRQEPIYEAVFG